MNVKKLLYKITLVELTEQRSNEFEEEEEESNSYEDVQIYRRGISKKHKMKKFFEEWV
jgi:hypothetical protein